MAKKEKTIEFDVEMFCLNEGARGMFSYFLGKLREVANERFPDFTDQFDGKLVIEWSTLNSTMAYCNGVINTLNWLTGCEGNPLDEEVLKEKVIPSPEDIFND